MTTCKDCVNNSRCTKTFGNIFGYCEIGGMTREELEQAVYDIVSSDMSIVLFHSDEWIRARLREATDDDLMEYLEDV